jgi:hypothetical protein
MASTTPDDLGDGPTGIKPAEAVEIRGREGTVIPVVLPSPSPILAPSAFSFAIHKSGSVLLDHVIVDLCRAVGIEAFGFDNICFKSGLPISDVVPESGTALLGRPGYFFYGFRGFHGFMRSMDLSANKKVILVRDPRDILTSFFFSMALSHGLPPSGETRANVLRQRDAANAMAIDDYVLSRNVDFIRNNFRVYMALEGPSAKVFRYEDIIFDKRSWVAAINQWFHLGAPDAAVAAIADRHDIVPVAEDLTQHIRQVNPGNHKKHLTRETIAAIERQYADVMAHYGYA